jgi:hypothetical protein
VHPEAAIRHSNASLPLLMSIQRVNRKLRVLGSIKEKMNKKKRNDKQTLFYIEGLERSNLFLAIEIAQEEKDFKPIWKTIILIVLPSCWPCWRKAK